MRTPIRPALWFCACNLLAAALSAQCTNPTLVPDGNYTSGDHSQVDNNALSASNFAVSGSATATFVARNCIQLHPGFRATAGTAGTTFHAWVDIAPSAISVSPSGQTGMSQPFTWTVSSPSGQSNLAHVFALFNTTSDSTLNACYIHYDASSNLVYLADNASSNWLGGFTPSSSGSAGNSQCTVAGTGSSPNPTSAGAQLGLTLSVTFQPSFAGAKNEYLFALDTSGVYTEWRQMGTWTVPSAIQIMVTPSSFSVTVDGAPCSGSCSFAWPGGSVHTVAAPLSQVGGDGKTYVFSGWSDGGAISHSITVSDTPVTYGASFAAEAAQAGLVAPGNPAGYPLSCNAANCFSGGSYAYYDFVANYMWGVSRTIFSGPSSGYVLTHARANMTNDLNQNLGSACQSSANGTYYYNNGFSFEEADSSDPCQSGVYYYANADRIYTVTGTHSDSVGSSYGYSKASLAFVPSCKATDFNVLLDNTTNYSSATGPTIWIPQGSGGPPWSSAADGILASYTARNANDVSVHLVVPYTARKGRHDLGFPAAGSSNMNPWFGVVIYDATPSIQSVSPTSIAATVPTQVTIKGYGFGDHPTVYIGGVAYNVTGVQCNAPAQDSVTLTVTLPASLANSSAPVYVVSNGAGGQAFTGKPLGIQNQRGSATSNTVQISVTPPPPSITAMTTTPASLQIDSTGVAFEIDGNNLGTGMPALNFGSSGISNVVIMSYGGQKVTGTFDIPSTAQPGQYTATLTPAGSTQTATTTITLVPGTPIISGNQGIWWLGRAVVNDNCDPNSTDLSRACFYNSTQLTLTPGPGATAPTPTSPATWNLTDPLTGQPAAFVSTTCIDGGCSQVKITAISQPPTCGTVSVQATLGGVSSAPYTVVVDWPSTASAISWHDNEFNDQTKCPGCIGFQSDIMLRLVSACVQPMFGIDVHEEFPAGFQACGGSTGWAGSVQLSGTRTDTGVNAGNFGDQVISAATPGGRTPDPQCPGKPATGQCVADPVPPTQLSAQANASGAQFIFVGSQDVQTLGKYFTAAPNKQVRYIDHGRDEPGTWTCPAQ